MADPELWNLFRDITFAFIYFFSIWLMFFIIFRKKKKHPHGSANSMLERCYYKKLVQ